MKKLIKWMHVFRMFLLNSKSKKKWFSWVMIGYLDIINTVPGTWFHSGSMLHRKTHSLLPHCWQPCYAERNLWYITQWVIKLASWAVVKHGWGVSDGPQMTVVKADSPELMSSLPGPGYLTFDLSCSLLKHLYLQISKCFSKCKQHFFLVVITSKTYFCAWLRRSCVFAAGPQCVSAARLQHHPHHPRLEHVNRRWMNK